MGADEAVLVRRAISALLPPFGLGWLALAACLAALASRRMRSGAIACASVAMIALLAMSTPWVATRLVDSLERRAGPALDEAAARALGQPRVGPAGRRAEAVVVLGGGMRTDARDRPIHGPTAQTLERVRAAATLARRSGLPVATSGGSPFGARRPEAEVMADVLVADYGVKPRWIESGSLDTETNARLSARLLAESGIRRIVLVTHAYHMPRARLAFEAAGFEIVPAPTGFRARHDAPEPLGWLPGAPALALAQVAVHEWAGIAAFHARRRIAGLRD